MAVSVDAFTGDTIVPKEADVVVIGGGIVGVTTALFLAEDGRKVVLCEKGIIAGEQSSRNWGWCRSMGRDPRELPLMVESLKLWRGMNDRIGAETGFRQRGTLYICPDEATFAKREAWLPYAKEHGVDSSLLRGSEVNAVLDGSVKTWLGALHTPSDGVAEPSMAVPAMAEAARKKGATILTGCAVRGLDIEAGRVAGVVTEKGRIKAPRVVIAGGVWSRLFLRPLGLRLPQLKVLATVLRTAPLEQGGPSTAAWGPGLAIRKRLDGGYTISHGGVVADIVPDSFRFFFDFLSVLRSEWGGVSLKFGKAFFGERRLTRPWSLDGRSPFEQIRVLDPAPAPGAVEEARANLEAAFPAFKGVATAASWAGMIDATPDLIPVISEVDAVPGLVISTGYSGHGFGIGPGAGRLTADIASGRTPLVDPAPFRFSRFTDGSKVQALAGL